MNVIQQSIDDSRLSIRNNIFFQLLFIFVVLGGALLLSMSKGDVVLFLNGIHSPWLDDTVKYITILGDGIIFGLVALVILIKNYKHFLFLAGVGLFHGAWVFLFKKVIFHLSPRPIKYFPSDFHWNYIDGVATHTINSFPSGHSTTIFALAASLALLYPKDKIFGMSCFLLALLVGFSRVYMLQHFFEDVYAGAFLGSVSAVLVYMFFSYVQRYRLHDFKKLIL